MLKGLGDKISQLIKGNSPGTKIVLDDNFFSNLFLESIKKIKDSFFPGTEMGFAIGEDFTVYIDKDSFNYMVRCDSNSSDEINISSALYLNTKMLNKLAKQYTSWKILTKTYHLNITQNLPVT